MRIALFSDTYPPNVNGVANTLGRLVREAHRRGDEVALFTPRISEGGAEYSSVHLQSAGIPVPVYPELQLALPDLPGVARSLEAFEPDLVHLATESSMGLAGRRWAIRNRRPIVTSFHTNYADYARGYRLGAFEGGIWRYLRWFHHSARITFHPSRVTGELLQSKGFRSPARLWSRGVDAEAFSPVHRSSEVREEIAPGAETILLFVGRIAPEKSCALAVEAFTRIRPDFPGCALVFVGDGPARPDLEAEKVPGVYFIGYRRGRDLSRVFASGDLLLFPSTTETFGNVVLEAFASGLPAIVADQGGVCDTVADGETGYRCRPGNADDFAHRLSGLLGDPGLRATMGQRARAAALGRSWGKVFDSLWEGYREVVGISPLQESQWTT